MFETRQLVKITLLGICLLYALWNSCHLFWPLWRLQISYCCWVRLMHATFAALAILATVGLEDQICCPIVHLRKAGWVMQETFKVDRMCFFFWCRIVFGDCKRLSRILIHWRSWKIVMLRGLFLAIRTQNEPFPILHVPFFSRIAVFQFFCKFPLKQSSRFGLSDQKVWQTFVMAMSSSSLHLANIRAS